MTEIDWSGLLRAGILRLGLRPEQFWRLTPAELFLMLGSDHGQAPLTRARLEELARQFPDMNKGNSDGGN